MADEQPIGERVAVVESKVRTLEQSVGQLDARLWAIICGVAGTTALQLIQLIFTVKH